MQNDGCFFFSRLNLARKSNHQSSPHFLQFSMDTLRTSLVREFVFLAQDLQTSESTSSTEARRLVVSYRILSFLMVLGEVGIPSSFDDFLRYEWICGDDAGRKDASWGIVGVNGSQIAKAVLGGHLDSLFKQEGAFTVGLGTSFECLFEIWIA